jgi:hypothetical protein
MITAAQLWYVENVYPECVTHGDCKDLYEAQRMSEDDRFLWENKAKVLNTLHERAADAAKPIMPTDEFEQVRKAIAGGPLPTIAECKVLIKYMDEFGVDNFTKKCTELGALTYVELNAEARKVMQEFCAKRFVQ